MQCINPILLKSDNTDEEYYVPCGKCMPCRINKTQEWTIRLEFERLSHKDNSFITLTYDDKNLPKDVSLDKTHVQKFIKLLRYYLPNTPFKYYAVGEYGETERKYWYLDPKFSHGRPHYHILAFGLNPRDEITREAIASAWHKCDRQLLTNPYFKGVGEVNGDSIRYVCDYMQKKQYGINSTKEYGVNEPPFALCSQGLGLNSFLQERIKDIKENGFLYYNGRKVSIPRYFREKIGFENQPFLDEDDVFRTYCINNNLLSAAQIKEYDKYMETHRMNPYLRYLKEYQPMHLVQVNKMLEEKNNLVRKRKNENL